jgi:hypothetical protein
MLRKIIYTILSLSFYLVVLLAFSVGFFILGFFVFFYALEFVVRHENELKEFLNLFQ